MKEFRRTKGVILAAGLGTRLRPITDSCPKCLVPIAGRPLLDYWFDALQRCGVNDILINTHHLPGLVRAYVGQVADRGFRVVEAYEPVLRGSAGTIATNRHWMDDADQCLLIYADNLSRVDLRAMMGFHFSHADPVTMMLFHSPEPQRCGIAELDGNGRIIGFEEKPKHPKCDLANGGIYLMSADLFREIADMDAFDIGFDVLPRLAGRMRGWVADCYHRDIGTPAALQEAESLAPVLFGGAGSTTAGVVQS